MRGRDEKKFLNEFESEKIFKRENCRIERKEQKFCNERNERAEKMLNWENWEKNGRLMVKFSQVEKFKLNPFEKYKNEENNYLNSLIKFRRNTQH